MEFQSLESMYLYLQKSINLSLADDVFEEVKKVESQEIQDVVINSYDPTVYNRRTIDGIDDPNNISHNDVVNGLLEVSNDTQPNSDYNGNTDIDLIETIVTGIGYQYPRNNPYNTPRDFVSATVDVLLSTGGHVLAMKNGLQKRGFQVL